MAVQRNISIDSETWKRLKAEAAKRNRNTRDFAGEIITDFLGPAKEKTGEKAIILAAGTSSRMMKLTKDRPKCMLELGGKTILRRQIERLEKCGVKDIVIVRGYKKRRINYSGIRYISNPNFKENNALGSLMAANDEMNTSFIASYSDIVYEKDVVEKLLQCKDDICVVVDTDWKKAYVDRYQHPKEEAEKVVIRNGKVVKIAKEIPPVEASGEFIGMMKFSKKGAEELKKSFSKAKREYAGKVFHSAVSIEKAFLTDMIQELIDKGQKITPVVIKGNWKEIDTLEDYQKAKRKYKE